MVEVDTIVTLKKSHPCGNKEFKVVRVGADIKLKCIKCERVLLFTLDEFKRTIK